MSDIPLTVQVFSGGKYLSLPIHRWFGEYYFPNYTARYYANVEHGLKYDKAQAELEQGQLSGFLELECRWNDDSGNALRKPQSFTASLDQRYSQKAVLNTIYQISGPQGRGKTCALLSAVGRTIEALQRNNVFKRRGAEWEVWDVRKYFFMDIRRALDALPNAPPYSIFGVDDPNMAQEGVAADAYDSDLEQLDQVLTKARTDGHSFFFTSVPRKAFPQDTIFHICEPRFISPAHAAAHIIHRELLGEPRRLYTTGFFTLDAPWKVLTPQLTGVEWTDIEKHIAYLRAQANAVAYGAAPMGRMESDLLLLTEHPDFVRESQTFQSRASLLDRHSKTTRYTDGYRRALADFWLAQLKECVYLDKSGNRRVNVEEVSRRLPEIRAVLQGEKLSVSSTRKNTESF